MKTLIMLFKVLLIITQARSQDISLIAKNLEGIDVKIEEVTYKSKTAIRLTESPEAAENLAIVKGIQFTDGTITAELAGSPLPSANNTARGFIGVAFRVKKGDTIRYDCFYLRPTNGRADDQIRRNHSTQYIAHPEYPWFRLRKEFPSMYESYVDIVEEEWTKIKIEVKGKQAKLYVNDAEQPSLIVNSLLNAESTGGIALWVGQGTDGYFRNLKVTKN